MPSPKGTRKPGIAVADYGNIVGDWRDYRPPIARNVTLQVTADRGRG